MKAACRTGIRSVRTYGPYPDTAFTFDSEEREIRVVDLTGARAPRVR